MEEKSDKVTKQSASEPTRTTPPPVVSHTLLRTPVAAAAGAPKKKPTPKKKNSKGESELSAQMQTASDKLKEFSAGMSPSMPAIQPETLIHRTIAIAVELAPHIAAAPNVHERESRLEEALQELRQRLEDQADSQKAMLERMETDRLQYLDRIRHADTMVSRMADQITSLGSKQDPHLVHGSSSPSVPKPLLNNPRNPSTTPETSTHHVSNSDYYAALEAPSNVIHSASVDSLVYTPYHKTKQTIRITPEHFEEQRYEFLRPTDAGECMRCGERHEFQDDLCTSDIDINGHPCPIMSEAEADYRVETKTLLKFFSNPRSQAQYAGMSVRAQTNEQSQISGGGVKAPAVQVANPDSMPRTEVNALYITQSQTATANHGSYPRAETQMLSAYSSLTQPPPTGDLQPLHVQAPHAVNMRLLHVQAPANSSLTEPPTPSDLRLLHVQAPPTFPPAPRISGFQPITQQKLHLPPPSAAEKLTLERIHSQKSETEYDRDISRRRQGLQSLALSQQQALPPPLPALAARNMPSQEQVELDIIAKAQARLSTLRTKATHNGQTITAPNRAPSARKLELRVAAAAGEDLRDSHKIKHEKSSSDDENEVQAELRASIAAHNMFNPRDKKKTKSKAGYVLSDFVRNDSEEEEQIEDGGDDGELDDGDDDGDDEEPEDSDPDWTPTSSPTPSPKRKSSQSSVTSVKVERKITQSELEELHKLRKHVQKQAMAIPELLATLSTRTKSQPDLELDTHGRPPRDHVPRIDYTTKPPVHGAWDDINYFMKEYMPLYDKYKATCGSGHFDTIWEGYSPSQRRRISKFLSRMINGEQTVRSVEFLGNTTNEDFVKMMCAAKGFGTTALTEIALRKILFKCPITDETSWVNFETDWEECLIQTSKNGVIDKKRLVVIYREGIPDPFFQRDLSQHRFDTWIKAHEHMSLQITRPEFLIQWHDDVISRKIEQKQQPKVSTPHGHQTGSSNGGGGAGANVPAHTPAGQFDPMTFKDKHGNLNINPNMKQNLDLNQSKTPCVRCDKVKKWNVNMCSDPLNKAGEKSCPLLPLLNHKHKQSSAGTLDFSLSLTLKSGKTISNSRKKKAQPQAAQQCATRPQSRRSEIPRDSGRR
jgi:hypothetical protein